MKTKVSFLVVLFLLAFNLSSVYSIPPTFRMSIRNVVTFPNELTSADSVMQFDIYLIWTNSTAPGVDPFEYGATNLNIVFNPLIANGGTLTSSRVTALPPGGLIPQLQTQSTHVIVNPYNPATMLFQGSAPGLTGVHNFIVSTVFPGTCIGRFKIRTSAHILASVTPDLRFRLEEPVRTFLAYMEPSTDPKQPDNQQAVSLLDTVANQYIVEENPVLPVELASFTSAVVKNNVTLSWSTSREINNKGFEVERSAAGSAEWIRAGYVQGNGTTAELKNYSFTERISSGQYKYRLKQIDFNGNTEYFNLAGEIEVGIPSAYSLSQNYPNPFNPSTKIDYDIPVDGRVSILLYDISGREAGKLVDKFRSAGYYTVQFNASNLSSGIYFYRITAQTANGNFVQTKRMMLVK